VAEFVHEAGLHPETYFDSAAIIIGLILLGAGSSTCQGPHDGAIGAWWAPGHDGRRLRDGVEEDVSSRSSSGRPSPRPAGDKVPWRRRRTRARRRWMIDAHRRAIPATKGAGDEVIGATLNTPGRS